MFIIHIGVCYYLKISLFQYPIAFQGQEDIEKAKYGKLKEVLGWAKDFIAETGYVAGTEKITIADICFLATLSSIMAAGNSIVTHIIFKLDL